MRDEATFECDDTDDPEHCVLAVFPAGNGDWYTQIRQKEPPTTAARLPLTTRWRTSGGDHPWAAILCVIILHAIGKGDHGRALELARSLVDSLGRDREIEPNWPPSPGHSPGGDDHDDDRG